MYKGDIILIYNPKDLISVLKFVNRDCPSRSKCFGMYQRITEPEDTDTGYKVKIQCESCRKIFWKTVDRMDVSDKAKITFRETKHKEE